MALRVVTIRRPLKGEPEPWRHGRRKLRVSAIKANGFARADARSLTDTRERWLVDHIFGIDVQLKDWVVGH